MTDPINAAPDHPASNPSNTSQSAYKRLPNGEYTVDHNLTDWELNEVGMRLQDRDFLNWLSEKLLFGTSPEIERVRFSRREPQLEHYPSGWSFHGLPPEWFLTLAAALIWEARMKLGLTQRGFAQLTSRTEASVSRIANGRQDLTVGSLVKMLEAAGLHMKISLVQMPDGLERS